jgi:hypothetical protein
LAPIGGVCLSGAEGAWARGGGGGGGAGRQKRKPSSIVYTMWETLTLTQGWVMY